MGQMLTAKQVAEVRHNAAATAAINTFLDFIGFLSFIGF